VLAFVGVRFLANLYLRFPYVFVTSIARGLGVDLETLTLVLGLRELSGAASPAVGAVVDRGHVRRTLLLAGVVGGAACTAAVFGGIVGFAVAMVVGGLAKFAIDVAQNAWMGHAVPLARRGRVMGWVEASWAASFLVGIPVLAWCIDTWGWRSAFWVTGPAIALASVAATTGRTAPSESVAAHPPLDSLPTMGTHHPHRVPARWAVLAFVAAQPMVQMLVFAVNGDWFAEGLGLSNPEIGAVAVALGVAELVGTLLTVAVAPRLGQERSGRWAFALVVPTLAVLPLVDEHATAGIVTMFVMVVALEFAFVAVLPLVTESEPARRGRAMSRAMVVMTVSRAVGSPVAGWIYVRGGIGTIGLVAAAVAAVGTGALALGVREERR